MGRIRDPKKSRGRCPIIQGWRHGSVRDINVFGF